MSSSLVYICLQETANEIKTIEWKKINICFLFPKIANKQMEIKLKFFKITKELFSEIILINNNREYPYRHKKKEKMQKMEKLLTKNNIDICMTIVSII